MSIIRRRLIGVVLSAAGALALAASPAIAGTISDNADCSSQAPMSQAFLPWLDISNYGLAPGGSFEAGAPSWNLTGNAATVTGNERYFANTTSDSRSLKVPSGSSATSAPMCVGLEWPTIRFFTRSSGTGLLSLLHVEVLFDSALTGTTLAVPIGVALPSGDWQPTLPMVTVVNALGALHQDGMIPVAFRFTPFGGSSWQIDDLYVDPWRGP